jgi:hypothetical protein
MLQASDIECPRELRCGREIDLLHNGKRQQSKAETRGKAEPVARERRPRAGAAERNGTTANRLATIIARQPARIAAAPGTRA